MLPCHKEASDYPGLERAMLVNFCLTNFKSFKGMEEFTMMASEKPAGKDLDYLCYEDDRVIHAGDPQQELLPVSAIFGANSYGKSNFVEALLLVQSLVLDPARKGEKIPVSPFFIDPESKGLPTSFELNILSGDTEYEIYIKLDESRIIEERVSMVRGESVEDMYNRKESLAVNGRFDPDGKVRLALESSHGNTLLLSSGILRGMDEFKPIYNWFKDTLLIVSSRTRFIYANDSDVLSGRIGRSLWLLDTGVETIKMVPAKLDGIGLTKKQIGKLRKNLKLKESAYFANSNNEIFSFKIVDGVISAKLIKIVKKDSKGSKFCVSTRDESDGTQRILWILTAVLQPGLTTERRVLIIDDFDKGLHFDITRSLVDYHLNGVLQNHFSQLIFTTYDPDLIDNFILRDDEVWIIEKGNGGVSEMTCLIEFGQSEEDMSSKQDYKAGTFGGAPNTILFSPDQLAMYDQEHT